jgi:hypothetical protein
MLGLSPKEARLLQKLTTPQLIQEFLDALPINHEKNGETCYSPRMVLRERKAHCLEGAFLAATALMVQGMPPLIMNFRTLDKDEDHAVALFKQNGYWGALSKTNHPILRYRDPVYRTVRELAMSYFHEYFMFENGEKTLRAYSRPVNLRRFGTKWITSEKDLWDMAYALADAPHLPMVPKKNLKALRPAPAFERTAVAAVEWKKRDPRT